MKAHTASAAPGPGRWDRDNSHFPLPISRYLWELFVPAYLEGAPRGFARCGSLIRGFELARVKGRVYQRTYFVVEPGELEERQHAAEHAIAQKLWRSDRAAWSEARETFNRRLLKFACKDPSAMSPSVLQAHLLGLRGIFQAGVVRHFFQQPASLFPVGDWIQRTCEESGATPSLVIGLLQGSCSETSDFLCSIGNVAAAIRSSPDADATLRDVATDAGVRLERLRNLPEVGPALDAYLSEFADRILAGFDVTDQTLRELPHFTLAVILARVDSATERGSAVRQPSEVEEAIREQLPASARDEFGRGLIEARAAYGLHDADIRITYLWPLGLIRRALLASSRKLVESGALHRPNDIFQGSPSEIDALLLGGEAPSADELHARADEWQEWASEETPPSFGDPETPPSWDKLRSACRRMNSALAFYIGQMEARNIQPAQPSWSMLVEGIPASSGRYEGWARVIRGPEDFASLRQGDVLVARTTSPAYNILFSLVGAVVTDRGGALCHTAIIAREFGLPAVVGADQATARIPDGARVLVDGDRGFVAVRTG